MRSKRVLRALSLVLLQTFLVRELAFAEGLAPLLKDGLEPKASVSIRFPASTASVEDAYQAELPPRPPSLIKEGGTGGVLFYLLQDAHTNESGQYNLAKALSIILEKEKDLRYVFTEAGVGDNSLSFLRKYGSENEREDVANSYIRKGYLHGAEYLDLTSEQPFTLWGVEDLSLYSKALEDYRQVAKERERFERYLDKIEATVETLKGRLFSPSLATFAKERKEYREEKLPLTSYFSALMRESQLQNIPLADYPHLGLLRDLKDREEKIDFPKANAEHRLAVESLSAKDRTELKTLSEAGKNKADKVLQGRKDVQAYFFALEEKLGEKKNDYPALSEYFDYLKTSGGLEAAQVLTEMSALENEILARLFHSGEEKTLLACDDSLYYQRKLFRFTLTPEEYASYKDRERGLPIEGLTGFLNKQIMDLDAYYERSLYLEEGYGDIVKRAEGFYETTKERDEQFLKASLEKLEKEGSSKAVLITGGFHTANLKALLKAKGISYVSVTPQVWQETNLKKYESVLLGQDLKALKPVTAPVNAGTIAVLDAMTDRAWGDGLVRDISGKAAVRTGARLAVKPTQTNIPDDLAKQLRKANITPLFDEPAPAKSRPILTGTVVALGLFGAAYFLYTVREDIAAIPRHIGEAYLQWEHDMESRALSTPHGARLANVEVPKDIQSAFEQQGLVFDLLSVRRVVMGEDGRARLISDAPADGINSVPLKAGLAVSILQALAGSAHAGVLSQTMGRLTKANGQDFGKVVDSAAVVIGKKAMETLAKALDITIIIGGNEGSFRDESADLKVGMVINPGAKNGSYFYFGDSVEVTNGVKRDKGRPGTSSMIMLIPAPMMPSTDGYRISLALDKFNPNEPFPAIDPVITSTNTLKNVLSQIARYMGHSTDAEIDAFIRQMASEYNLATLNRPKHDQLTAQAKELGFGVVDREDGDPLLFIRAMLGVKGSDGKKLFALSTGGANEHIMAMVFAALFGKALMYSTYASTETLKAVDKAEKESRNGSLERANEFTDGDMDQIHEVNRGVEAAGAAGLPIALGPTNLQQAVEQVLNPRSAELSSVIKGPAALVITSNTGANEMDWGELHSFIKPVTWRVSDDGQASVDVSGFFIGNDGHTYFYDAELNTPDAIEARYRQVAANIHMAEKEFQNPLFALYDKVRAPLKEAIRAGNVEPNHIYEYASFVTDVLSDESGVGALLHRVNDAARGALATKNYDGLEKVIGSVDEYFLGSPSVVMEDGSVYNIVQKSGARLSDRANGRLVLLLAALAAVFSVPVYFIASAALQSGRNVPINPAIAGRPAPIEVLLDNVINRGAEVRIELARDAQGRLLDADGSVVPRVPSMTAVFVDVSGVGVEYVPGRYENGALVFTSPSDYSISSTVYVAELDARDRNLEPHHFVIRSVESDGLTVFAAPSGARLSGIRDFFLAPKTQYAMDAVGIGAMVLGPLMVLFMAAIPGAMMVGLWMYLGGIGYLVLRGILDATGILPTTNFLSSGSSAASSKKSISEDSSGARLAEQTDNAAPPAPAPILMVPDPSQTISDDARAYYKVTIEPWYESNSEVTLRDSVERMRDGGNVLDASTGTGAGSLAVARILKESGRSAGKLIGTDVDFPLARQYISFAMQAVAPYLGTTFSEIEHYILPFDKATKTYAPISEIPGIEGQMDLVLLMNAVHLMTPAQRASVFQALHKALRPGGELAIGSAGLESTDRTVMDAVLLDSLFANVHDRVLHIVREEPQYADIRDEVLRLAGDDASIKTRHKFIPEPTLTSDIVKELRAAGFELIEERHETTQLDHTGLETFLTGIEAYSSMAYPELKGLPKERRQELLKKAYEGVFSSAKDNVFQMWWTSIVVRRPDAGARLAESAPEETAILFPPAGIHNKDSGRDLYDKYEYVRRITEIVNNKARLELGDPSFDVWDAKTVVGEHTAALAYEIALWEVYKREYLKGRKPKAIMGVSRGSIAAFYSAGAFDDPNRPKGEQGPDPAAIELAVELMIRNTQFLEKASEEAGKRRMIVVFGLTEEVLKPVLERHEGAVVTIKISNKRFIISAPDEVMEALKPELEGLRGRVIPSVVTVSSHDPNLVKNGGVIRPLAAAFEQYLRTAVMPRLHTPKVPLYSSVTGDRLQSPEELVEDAWRFPQDPILLDVTLPKFQKTVGAGHFKTLGTLDFIVPPQTKEGLLEGSTVSSTLSDDEGIRALLAAETGARLAEWETPAAGADAFKLPPVVLQALRVQLAAVKIQENYLRFWFGRVPGFEMLYQESLLHDYRALLELMLVSDHVVVTDLFQQIAGDETPNGARLAGTLPVLVPSHPGHTLAEEIHAEWFGASELGTMFEVYKARTHLNHKDTEMDVFLRADKYKGTVRLIQHGDRVDIISTSEVTQYLADEKVAKELFHVILSWLKNTEGFSHVRLHFSAENKDLLEGMLRVLVNGGGNAFRPVHSNDLDYFDVDLNRLVLYDLTHANENVFTEEETSAPAVTEEVRMPEDEAFWREEKKLNSAGDFLAFAKDLRVWLAARGYPDLAVFDEFLAQLSQEGNLRVTNKPVILRTAILNGKAVTEVNLYDFNTFLNQVRRTGSRSHFVMAIASIVASEAWARHALLTLQKEEADAADALKGLGDQTTLEELLSHREDIERAVVLRVLPVYFQLQNSADFIAWASQQKLYDANEAKTHLGRVAPDYLKVFKAWTATYDQNIGVRDMFAKAYRNLVDLRIKMPLNPDIKKFLAESHGVLTQVRADGLRSFFDEPEAARVWDLFRKLDYSNKVPTSDSDIEKKGKELFAKYSGKLIAPRLEEIMDSLPSSSGARMALTADEVMKEVMAHLRRYENVLFIDEKDVEHEYKINVRGLAEQLNDSVYKNFHTSLSGGELTIRGAQRKDGARLASAKWLLPDSPTLSAERRSLWDIVWKVEGIKQSVKERDIFEDDPVSYGVAHEVASYLKSVLLNPQPGNLSKLRDKIDKLRQALIAENRSRMAAPLAQILNGTLPETLAAEPDPRVGARLAASGFAGRETMLAKIEAFADENPEGRIGVWEAAQTETAPLAVWDDTQRNLQVVLDRVDQLAGSGVRQFKWAQDGATLSISKGARLSGGQARMAQTVSAELTFPSTHPLNEKRVLVTYRGKHADSDVWNISVGDVDRSSAFGDKVLWHIQSPLGLTALQIAQAVVAGLTEKQFADLEDLRAAVKQIVSDLKPVPAADEAAGARLAGGTTSVKAFIEALDSRDVKGVLTEEGVMIPFNEITRIEHGPTGISADIAVNTASRKNIETTWKGVLDRVFDATGTDADDNDAVLLSNGARLARKGGALSVDMPGPQRQIFDLFREAAQQDFNTAAFLQRFQLRTALAHADEFKGAQDEKILTIRLDEKTLLTLGHRYDRATGQLTVTNKDSNESAVLDVHDVQETPQGPVGKISLSDAKLLDDQAHAAIVAELGVLTELHTEKKVLILESSSRIGQPGVSPALAVFAANALRHIRERKDTNVRFGVEGMDAAILREHLSKLETDNRLAPGTLTAWFELDGFEPQETVYITSPGSLKPQSRNLVVKSNAAADMTLAAVSGRLDAAELTRPEFISAVKTRLDRTVRFDIDIFLRVLKGLEESIENQELYALLPAVELVDWQMGARLAALQLRTTGSAA